MLSCATNAWQLLGPGTQTRYLDSGHLLWAVAETASAAGREIRYRQISPEDFAAGLPEMGLPENLAWLLNYLFSTVLDGRNAYLTDGVQRALGRGPRDFGDFRAGHRRHRYVGWLGKQRSTFVLLHGTTATHDDATRPLTTTAQGRKGVEGAKWNATKIGLAELHAAIVESGVIVPPVVTRAPGGAQLCPARRASAGRCRQDSRHRGTALDACLNSSEMAADLEDGGGPGGWETLRRSGQGLLVGHRGTRPPRIVASGPSLIGLAFGPHGQLVVISNDTAHRFD